MNRRAQLGTYGEDLVSKKLEQDGFSIVDRNYRKQFGEIDIIATKPELIVFVEVKMRRRSYFHLSELITYSKQQKIISVANYYLARYNHTDKVAQFDVALVEYKADEATITYIPNAFTESKSGW